VSGGAVRERHGVAAGAHRAAGRVVDILELVVRTHEGLPLRELSAQLEAPKSSLLPLLRTLTARGYLEQGALGAYRLGPKAFELGMASPAHRAWPEIARPALRELMQRTGETVFLGSLGGDGTAVVFVPAPERERILRALPLKRYTDRTVTSLPALRAALAEVRQTGVCVNLDELAVGAAGIAAPIFDRDGRVAGACAIGGPTDRVRPRLKPLAAEVKATARAISALLGHRIAPPPASRKDQP
jgi:DNA-binding IclR family transcriptional regulator